MKTARFFTLFAILAFKDFAFTTAVSSIARAKSLGKDILQQANMQGLLD